MKDWEDSLKDYLRRLQMAHYCHEIDYREYREKCKQALASCEREMQYKYGENAEKVAEMYLVDYDIL